MSVRTDAGAGPLLIPGFAPADESLRALRRTTPELALLALLGRTTQAEFLCIGRDDDGQPTVVIVAGGEFRAWLAAADAPQTH